jgi:hypothetical protein
MKIIIPTVQNEERELKLTADTEAKLLTLNSAWTNSLDFSHSWEAYYYDLNSSLQTMADPMFSRFLNYLLTEYHPLGTNYISGRVATIKNITRDIKKIKVYNIPRAKEFSSFSDRTIRRWFELFMTCPWDCPVCNETKNGYIELLPLTKVHFFIGFNPLSEILQHLSTHKSFLQRKQSLLDEVTSSFGGISEKGNRIS